MPEGMSPLQEASLDDLLDELGRRMDHAVFAGLHVQRDDGPEVGGTFVVDRWSKGNHVTCIGLATELGIHIRDAERRRREEDQDDGEAWKRGSPPDA